MQCKSDAIKLQERAWGRNPGTMPTYLFSRPCRANPNGSGSVALALAVRQAETEVESKEGGGENSPPRRIESNQVAGQRGVIGPTQNQNIRSRVGQATTRQRDWQAHAKFRHETRQNASQRSHFPFQPNPCVQLFPGLSRLCAGLSGCLDPGLASSCISSLHCSTAHVRVLLMITWHTNTNCLDASIC